jgi:hypothetical protein
LEALNNSNIIERGFKTIAYKNQILVMFVISLSCARFFFGSFYRYAGRFTMGMTLHLMSLHQWWVRSSSQTASACWIFFWSGTWGTTMNQPWDIQMDLPYGTMTDDEMWTLTIHKCYKIIITKKHGGLIILELFLLIIYICHACTPYCSLQIELIEWSTSEINLVLGTNVFPPLYQ